MVVWSKMALDILVFERPMSKAIGLQAGVKQLLSLYQLWTL